jgi:hypothetical protein
MKTTHYLQMSAMSFAALLLLLVTFVSADSHGTSQYLVHDPKSAEELSEAIDAAIMTVLSKPKWFSNLKNTHQYVQAHLVTTCSPSPSKWQWPDKASATGLLKRVFDSNELKVAGVQWASQIADYTTDGLNPTGYWADYLQAIVDEFNAHYSTSVQIRRIYYPNSVEVGDRVADGTVDMSEPYYYLGGFHGGKPRIESLHFSCVTAGTAGIFIVKSDARINTLDALNSAIASGSNKKIGFIGQGNYDSVKDILDDTAVAVFETDGVVLANQVADGTLLAGYVSEGAPPDPTRFMEISTGIISPRVALFKKDVDTCSCPDNTNTNTNTGAADAGGACTGTGTGGSSRVVINMFNSQSGSCN